MPSGAWALLGGYCGSAWAGSSAWGSCHHAGVEREEGAPSHPPPSTLCFHPPFPLLISLCCH